MLAGRAAAALAILVATSTHARAVDPSFVREAQLFGHLDPNGQPGHDQGYSVSASGDTAVLGAPSTDGTELSTVYVFVRTGSTWTEQQKLAAGDVVQNEAFGWAVSLSGDTLVVGTPFGVTTAGSRAGRAYVYVRSGSTWSLQQELTASDGGVDRFFGYSVSISGDTLVVGAPPQSDPGSAYVFVRSGAQWTQQQKLMASDGATGDRFGYSVSVHGDTLVVGAPPQSDAGSAYVFGRSGTSWTEQQKFSGAESYDSFGASVSMSTDTIAVAARGESTPAGAYAGAVHVFVRSGTVWTEQQRLTPADQQAYHAFGDSVAVSGNTVVVGQVSNSHAYVFVRSGTLWTEQQALTASDRPGYGFGRAVSLDQDTALVGAPEAAYAYVRAGTTWAEEQKIHASDASAGDMFFGYSTSISGDTLAVGAGTYQGYPTAVYVFVRTGTTWVEQQRLTGSDTGDQDGFGSSVALEGDTLVVGAQSKDGPAGLDTGAVYVFVRTGALWTEQQKLTASDEEQYLGLGAAVGLSGDTAVLGTESAHPTTPGGPGAAYVFVRSGASWSEQQKLSAADQSVNDGFGLSVCVSGDTLVAGASGADFPAGPNAGAAYVFVRSGSAWSLQQQLLASDAGPGRYFGNAVALSADTVVVGDEFATSSTGAAYVFVRSGISWSEQQKLTASDGPASVEFGSAVAVAGDIAVVGARFAEEPPPTQTGAAYVFVRSGTTWSESQKLLADDPERDDSFSAGLSISGDTIAVGAPGDDIPYNVDAGSVYSFRLPQADLAISKTDGQASAVPGESVTYTITVSNAGPLVAPGTSVIDTPPAALSGATWTCSSSAGSSCTASGTGGISDTANLLVGGIATYTLTAGIDPAATGMLGNTATVTISPGGTDPNPGSNSATDTDTLTPETNLAVSKTDGQTSAVPGQVVSYTIAATNAGPSVAAGALVADAVPAGLQGTAWTCSASSGSSCAPSGSGGISDTVTALVGGSLTYTLAGTVDIAATLALVNTASVAPAAGATDPAMANNSATDVDALPVGFPIEGELAHGYDQQHDLAALPGPVANENVFRIYQRPHASYEVLVDGISGDLGAGSGPLLERLASDASTVLQASSPAGAGGSRSLRWMNPLDQPMVEDFVRVRSAGCTTDCDAADVYRLKVRETTGFVPRFNNSGTQITVLVLENGGDEALDMDVRFWSQNGAPLGGIGVTLGARQAYVLNTSTIVPGSGGSITVANTGRYGQLAGKSVAVEPGTGFAFDTALRLRPR